MNSIFKLLRVRSDKIDDIIHGLFAECNSAGTAIFALGGYGRREMTPYSDIDLLFLHDNCIDTARKMVDKIIYPLLEQKYEAGGATRTIKECEEMFFGHISAQSAMLDARLICGDAELAERFTAVVKKTASKKSWIKQFTAGKYAEQMQRFKRYGGTVYMLEPHIKEGKGGLREYHSALQISKWGSRLQPSQILEGLNNELSFLFELRSRLYDCRLSFEKQLSLAIELSMTPDELMSGYYRSAAAIHDKTREIFDRFAPFWQKFKKNWHESSVRKLVGGAPSWMRLVAHRDILDSALLYLHKTGELKKMIPEFAKLYFKCQYGAYHVYTVDIHSIFCVQRLVELEKGSGPKHIGRIYKKIKQKDILLLSALLHDIGKDSVAAVGVHPQIGAQIARDSAIALGYNSSDAEKVSYLVHSHLVMPKLAFSRDINDPHLIEKFADSVPSKGMLEMLYVLSYADIASIGPDVWNGWKERLLREFYLSAERYMRGLQPEVQKKEFQIKVLKACVEHKKFPAYSEWTVTAKNMPGTFSKICSVMAANRINILEAELNDAGHGFVLDILRVVNDNGAPLTENESAFVQTGLMDVLEGRKDASSLSFGSAVKPLTPHVETRVEIDNEAAAKYTIIDVFTKDRIGVLYEITKALFELGCDIGLAKIVTKAELAQDSFYLRDAADGKKILSENRLNMIKDTLVKACSG